MSSFFITLLAVVVGVPAAIYFMQDSLIFYPRPLDTARRTEIRARHPAVEEVFLESGNQKRHAWHLKGAPGGTLVIYFGGNAEETSWMLDEVSSAPGVSWLLVSYRGYGLSEGSPGETALVSDALQWFDHAMTLPGADAKRTYVFGRSLGSGVAVALAAQRPVAGLILAAPYDSLAAVAKRYYWYVPVDLLLKHRFDSIALAPRLQQPLLCLIAGKDEVIPPVHGERLFDAWAGPKKKVVLAEAGHNTMDSHPLFWPSIREFLPRQVN